MCMRSLCLIENFSSSAPWFTAHLKELTLTKLRWCNLCLSGNYNLNSHKTEIMQTLKGPSRLRFK